MVEQVVVLLGGLIKDFCAKKKIEAAYLVVTNPNKSCKSDPFKDSILWEGPIGGDIAVEKYQSIAKAKAYTSWTTKKSSKEVTEVHPLLLQTNHSVWGGSVVKKLAKNNILVVAVSGFKEYEDQFIARTVIEALKMKMSEVIYQHRYENLGVIE